MERYGLRCVPVTVMSVIYTAGTTWLIAASETSHKKQTKLRYLGYAEKCVEYLRETGMIWKTGARLERLLKAIIDEQRGKLDGTLLPSRNSIPTSGVTSEAPSSASTIKGHVPPSTSMIHENTLDTTSRSLRQETTTLIPPDYFSQDIMGGLSEQDIISSHFEHEPSPNSSTFAKNNFILSGSIASTSPVSQMYQKESSNVIAPDAFDLFGQDPANGFDSSMDWYHSIFGTSNSTIDDVDMSNVVGYSEQGMPVGGGFPSSSSSFLPGIYTQQQLETDWLIQNVLS
jgi:hypothetical protein